MVQFRPQAHEIIAKIVYYGSGLCGKTTNLRTLYEGYPESTRGELVVVPTAGDRTIFFDFLPVTAGTLRGMQLRVQLYTVPGQVQYNATRQVVLRGVDGLVFVADSQKEMVRSNRESWENLKENLALQGTALADLPHVLQYNKRDLHDIVAVDELDQILNEYNAPFFEAVATEGIGVEETLQGIVKLVVRSLRDRFKVLGEAVPAPPIGVAPLPGARPTTQPIPTRPPAPTARPVTSAPAVRTTTSPPIPAPPRVEPPAPFTPEPPPELFEITQPSFDEPLPAVFQSQRAPVYAAPGAVDDVDTPATMPSLNETTLDIPAANVPPAPPGFGLPGPPAAAEPLAAGSFPSPFDQVGHVPGPPTEEVFGVRGPTKPLVSAAAVEPSRPVAPAAQPAAPPASSAAAPAPPPKAPAPPPYLEPVRRPPVTRPFTAPPPEPPVLMEIEYEPPAPVTPSPATPEAYVFGGGPEPPVAIRADAFEFEGGRPQAPRREPVPPERPAVPPPSAPVEPAAPAALSVPPPAFMAPPPPAFKPPAFAAPEQERSPFADYEEPALAARETTPSQAAGSPFEPVTPVPPLAMPGPAGFAAVLSPPVSPFATPEFGVFEPSAPAAPAFAPPAAATPEPPFGALEDPFAAAPPALTAGGDDVFALAPVGPVQPPQPPPTQLALTPTEVAAVQRVVPRAIAVYGEVRELELEVPVPKLWTGGQRMTLQLRLVLVPQEDENGG